MILFFKVHHLLKLEFSFTKSLIKFIFFIEKLTWELSTIIDLLNHKN